MPADQQSEVGRRYLRPPAFMVRKRVASLRCPTCKKLVLRCDPEFPFCSERCRLIDLGKWASGAYVVRGPALDPQQPEEHRPIPSGEEKDGGPDPGSKRKSQ